MLLLLLLICRNNYYYVALVGCKLYLFMYQNDFVENKKKTHTKIDYGKLNQQQRGDFFTLIPQLCKLVSDDNINTITIYLRETVASGGSRKAITVYNEVLCLRCYR